MEKYYSSKTLLKMAGGGMHPQHPPWMYNNKRGPQILKEMF